MIVSYVPGRIRLRFKELKNKYIASMIQNRSMKIPGMINTEINVLTGSILLEYDTKIISMEKLFELSKVELDKFNIKIDISI